jgi:hypothetical protein
MGRGGIRGLHHNLATFGLLTDGHQLPWGLYWCHKQLFRRKRGDMVTECRRAVRFVCTDKFGYSPLGQ